MKVMKNPIFYFKKTIFVSLYLLFYIKCLPAQQDTHFYKEKNYFLPQDSTLELTEKTLYFNLYNPNYIKNNEYFSPFDIGVTYFVSQLQPSFLYHFTKNLQIELGALAQLYYADNFFSHSFVHPIFRVNYRFHPTFLLTLGSLYGHFSHRWVEPLFSFDHAILSPTEYGIQLQHQSRFVEGEFYWRWKHQILKTTLDQRETFEVGVRTEIKPLAKINSQFTFEIPISTYFQHRGGQSDTLSTQPMMTLNNSDLALRFKYQNKNKKAFIQAVILQNDFLSFHAFVDRLLPMRNGWGNYVSAQLRTKYFNILAGYWKADHFFAPSGEALFSSIGQIPKQTVIFIAPKRSVITGKIDFYYKIFDHIYFLFNFGTYYHTDIRELDYYYGFALIIQQRWRIKKWE